MGLFCQAGLTLGRDFKYPLRRAVVLGCRSVAFQVECPTCCQGVGLRRALSCSAGSSGISCKVRNQQIKKTKSAGLQLHVIWLGPGYPTVPPWGMALVKWCVFSEGPGRTNRYPGAMVRSVLVHCLAGPTRRLRTGHRLHVALVLGDRFKLLPRGITLRLGWNSSTIHVHDAGCMSCRLVAGVTRLLPRGCVVETAAMFGRGLMCSVSA